MATFTPVSTAPQTFTPATSTSTTSRTFDEAGLTFDHQDVTFNDLVPFLLVHTLVGTWRAV